MYSFEGEYRRRPQMRLGGSSGSHKRDTVIQRAQAERQRRRQAEQQVICATRLQAFVRGCLQRAELRRRLRQEFDSGWPNLAASGDPLLAVSLAVRLAWFYQSTEEPDWSRLVSFCQLLLRQEPVRTALAGRHALSRLLHFCSASLDGPQQRPLAVPLRLLEVTLESPRLASGHIAHLVERGYFQHVRALLESRVPQLEEDVSCPPVPLAATVFHLVQRPLQLSASDSRLSLLVLFSFTQSFLQPPLSSQVQHWLLPALATPSAGFPLARCLSAVCERRAELRPSTWLLYSLLSLGRGELDTQPSTVLHQYLQLLDWTSSHLQPSRLHESSGTDSDSEDEMEVEETAEQRYENDVLREALESLNDSAHVQTLRHVLDSSSEPEVVRYLCGICYHLLNRDRMALHKHRLLYTLAFSRRFLRRLWRTVEQCSQQTALFGGERCLLKVLARGLEPTEEERDRLVPPLATFCFMFAHMLVTLQDSELVGDQDPLFPLSQLVAMSATLRDVYLGLVELAYPDLHASVSSAYSSALRSVGVRSVQPDPAAAHHWTSLLRGMNALLWQLQARDARLGFCPPDHWSSRTQPLTAERIPEVVSLFKADLQSFRPFAGPIRYSRDELESGSPIISSRDVRMMLLLRQLPFVFSFRQRVQLFQELIRQDKQSNQSDMDHFMTSAGNAISIAVRRNYLYEDAFEKLSVENEVTLKPRMRVQMINAKGLDEAGIDGGGIFREFLNELLKTSFDPNRGFFRITNNNQLYPNPHVDLLFENPGQHYFFIGRILGKAIYEQMLVELPLAAFFLAKLLGRHSDSVDIHYLDSLDPVMYKNLMYLSSYQGDIAELGLDFTVNVTELGESRVEELKPGGAQIAVTAANHIEYVHLMADYKLNRQIQRQCAALRQGLADVIPLEWLRLFDHQEMQTLISGAPVPVDVADLRAHTKYSGGFSEEHPVVRMFWQVAEELSDKQKTLLLKFVTSCSRPPLLGFKELYPPFCIHSAGEGDADRLPSASTCMNLLKLPEYQDAETMKQKLCYAIESGAGFELS